MTILGRHFVGLLKLLYWYFVREVQVEKKMVKYHTDLYLAAVPLIIEIVKIWKYSMVLEGSKCRTGWILWC